MSNLFSSLIYQWNRLCTIDRNFIIFWSLISLSLAILTPIYKVYTDIAFFMVPYITGCLFLLHLFLLPWMGIKLGLLVPFSSIAKVPKKLLHLKSINSLFVGYYLTLPLIQLNFLSDLSPFLNIGIGLLWVGLTMGKTIKTWEELSQISKGKI
jgi:hypothetical protein